MRDDIYVYNMSIDFGETCLTMIKINDYIQYIAGYAEKLLAAQEYSTELNERAEALLRAGGGDYSAMIKLSAKLNNIILDIMTFRENFAWALDGTELLMAQ